MATIYFKGIPCDTCGNIPAVGSDAPEFKLVTPELKVVTNSDFKGKRVVLNIFPSIDTDVCAMSVRRFNQEASALGNTVVLAVSMDLPFAAGRFCTANNIENVTPASAFRYKNEFDKNYGFGMVDGPLAGLLARGVVVIDENGKVIYSALVDEITDEPPYQEVIDVLKK